MREVLRMSRVIRGVTHPSKVFSLIACALNHGSVNHEQANAVMGYVRYSSKANQYFDFACQVGVLYEEDYDVAKEILYRPTEYGRQLYLRWREDEKAALSELLGSIPQYRFHTELLLTELILSSAVRSASLGMDIVHLMAEQPSWYLDRIRWIQDAIGWRDAGSFGVGQLSDLRTRIHGMLRTGRQYYEQVWDKWDNALGFGARPWRSNLTKAECLRDFLRATRHQPLRIAGESLDTEVLSTLVLLMVAKEQRYALSTVHCHDAVEKLLGLGVDIRQDDGTAYLFSAVELIIREADTLRQAPLGGCGLAAVDGLLAYILDKANARSRREAASVRLGDLFQHLRAEVLDHGLFVSTPLVDADNVPISSAIRFWYPPRLPDGDDYDFLEELIMLGNAKGKPPLPTADVFLNDSAFDEARSLDNHIAGNPHFALLLLLLYDVGGASERLRLVKETWRYKGVELIAALDQILRHFGYQVWAEGYRYSRERRQWLGRKLVNLACRLGVCRVDGVRLVERKGGPQFNEYYYKAVNAVTKIRSLELKHE